MYIARKPSAFSRFTPSFSSKYTMVESVPRVSAGSSVPGPWVSFRTCEVERLLYFAKSQRSC